MNYSVRLNWESNPHMVYWSEICAWTVEHFGLPGSRYLTHITQDYMIWDFVDDRDQLLFILAWGNDNDKQI